MFAKKAVAVLFAQVFAGECHTKLVSWKGKYLCIRLKYPAGHTFTKKTDVVVEINKVLNVLEAFKREIDHIFMVFLRELQNLKCLFFPSKPSSVSVGL